MTLRERAEGSTSEPSDITAAIELGAHATARPGKSAMDALSASITRLARSS